MSSISISTHVLDTASGLPVAGVPVSLAQLESDLWTELAAAATDADGRIGELVPDGPALPGGRYRVRFDLEGAGSIERSWYPEVAIVVDLADDAGHVHVPLLLAPYGYTTYRGS
ncbi:MAG: hydroxyisourate hydrolase [Solirubrobacteraceae bacterium]|nr:hydroxyisourate hydrolase [Solirubrobacteraceae bacterium]